MTGAIYNKRNDAARSGQYKRAVLFRRQRLAAGPLITSCRHALNSPTRYVMARLRYAVFGGISRNCGQWAMFKKAAFAAATGITSPLSNSLQKDCGHAGNANESIHRRCPAPATAGMRAMPQGVYRGTRTRTRDFYKQRKGEQPMTTKTDAWPIEAVKQLYDPTQAHIELCERWRDKQGNSGGVLAKWLRPRGCIDYGKAGRRANRCPNSPYKTAGRGGLKTYNRDGSDRMGYPYFYEFKDSL